MKILILTFFLLTQTVLAKDLKAYYFTCNNNLELVASLEDGYAWLFYQKRHCHLKQKIQKDAASL